MMLLISAIQQQLKRCFQKVLFTEWLLLISNQLELGGKKTDELVGLWVAAHIWFSLAFKYLPELL